jgi:hypothetical protein
MKIKETKTHFVAICTEDNEGGTIFKVGMSMGKMSKTTGGFAGATACLVELNKACKEHYFDKEEEKKQILVDKVIEEIKKDIACGDVTALDELLKFLPTERLKAYLPNMGE